MANQKLSANLQIRLRGFEQADTRSQLEGWLDPGKYVVLEYRQDYPDQDTDYALLLVPALGAGDTWICSRWKDQYFADINEFDAVTGERLDFVGTELAVAESQLVELLPQFAGFTYDRDEARYPNPLPGVSLPLAPPQHNNCCTFAEALLVEAWANTYPNFQWSRDLHAQMMILSSDDFYSPVTAAIDSGMAVRVTDVDIAPQPWTLIQGWRHQWRGGHTFIIVDHDADSDRVLTLESNSGYKLDGCGFRAIGNLRDMPQNSPPENWWDIDGLWTWERIRATYLHRQLASLKVKERSWSGLD
jgi:hypothetical protein